MAEAQGKKEETVNGSGQAAPQRRVALSPSLGDRVHYADGIHALSVRSGVVRIDLFQTLVASGKQEQRMVTDRIVLPVDAVNELMRMLQTMAKAAVKGEAKGGTKARPS
jgi:hypothetical protein